MRRNAWILAAIMAIAVYATAVSAAVTVAPWYPKGNDYVFICSADGFTPTSFNWNFDDGDLLFNYPADNVYHTFDADGVYDVSCTATDGQNMQTSMLQVQIGTVSTPGNQTPPSNQTCEVTPGDFRTQTQGGWGQGAKGDNPGTYRDANFDAAFPSGVRIGEVAGNSALFTSAQAIEDFLPATTTAGPLGQNYTNPNATDAGVLGGQTLALSLSVGFDAYDENFSSSNVSLASLVIVNSTSPCVNMTVQEVLDEANSFLAGNPSSFTASQLNSCTTLINENFVDGTTDNGNLAIPDELCGGGGTGNVCGNGILDAGEVCDGSAPEGFFCTAQCTLQEGMSCEEAVRRGLLTGTINGTTATVTNNADQSFDVSLAIYRMFSATIEDQELFDSETKAVGANSQTTLSVDAPACFYQIDLVCGQPLQTNPQYGNRMIESEFAGSGDYCIPDESEAVELSIAPWFPQDNNYVFVCNVDGFTPTSYNWYFGDGQKQLNSGYGSVYHSYAGNGVYTVVCTATDGVNEGSDTMTVTVGEDVQNVPVCGNQVLESGEACDGSAPEGYTCTEACTLKAEGASVCVESVADLAIGCTSGLKVQSAPAGGCVTVSCTNDAGSISAKVCEKDDVYEVYKQSTTGDAPDVCVEGVCLNDYGYRVVEPICGVTTV